MFTRSLFTAALAGLVTANSVPISGSYPGWTQGGNKLNIEVEFFIDYLCSDSRQQYGVMMNALHNKLDAGDMYMYDAISLKVSNFPLDYHTHSWQVAQILPYLIDRQ